MCAVGSVVGRFAESVVHIVHSSVEQSLLGLMRSGGLGRDVRVHAAGCVVVSVLGHSPSGWSHCNPGGGGGCTFGLKYMFRCLVCVCHLMTLGLWLLGQLNQLFGNKCRGIFRVLNFDVWMQMRFPVAQHVHVL